MPTLKHVCPICHRLKRRCECEKSEMAEDMRPSEGKLAKLEAPLRAWVEMQSSENTHRLYSAALAHFGIKPVIPD